MNNDDKNNNNNKEKKKSSLKNSYITYNNYINVGMHKNNCIKINNNKSFREKKQKKSNISSKKLSSSSSFINLPKPKIGKIKKIQLITTNYKNKINKKNSKNILLSKSEKNIFINKNDNNNIKMRQKEKIYVNLEIDLNNLINNSNIYKDNHKKSFSFSKSSKKIINNNININNFTKDFFIIPKLNKY